MTMKPISAGEVQQFLQRERETREAVNALTERVRTIRVTIVGPEAGPLAAGTLTALTQIARTIEGCYKGTTVKVSLE